MNYSSVGNYFEAETEVGKVSSVFVFVSKGFDSPFCLFATFGMSSSLWIY